MKWIEFYNNKKWSNVVLSPFQRMDIHWWGVDSSSSWAGRDSPSTGMLQDTLPSWQRYDIPLWVIQMPWEQLQLTTKSIKVCLKCCNFYQYIITLMDKIGISITFRNQLPRPGFSLLINTLFPWLLIASF